ncbi:uncharacterized protein KQ657_004291 [Scheffersomyces spartinae]|uniref:Uncharacterized protein n=1 Tax=Scheffersomyces spartinae TaxID=45513 RepID=A0A9P7VB92_9ASCO|nr:uncharacterized protein KQ657_004291 [Scheffersomyces spartinae]KAG7194615.1 hypothetical protein KQ657_004291 [Scheffersomyces spartinae]
MIRGLVSGLGARTVRIGGSNTLCSIRTALFSQSSSRSLTTSSSTPTSPIYQVENRNTFKPVLSRKTFLLDYYSHLNRTNKIILYVHHGHLNKVDNHKFRTDLTNAGAKLHILRNSIYNVFLRNSQEEDPASAEAYHNNKDKQHPLAPLLNGPTGIITIPTVDPSVVKSVVKILEGAQERMFLIGALVDSSVFTTEQIAEFKELPTQEQLQAQLVGVLTVLGGAGLVRTLESTPTTLYLTMKQREDDMSPEEEDAEKI